MAGDRVDASVAATLRAMAGLAHARDDDPARHVQQQLHRADETAVERLGELAERRRFQLYNFPTASQQFGIAHRAMRLRRANQTERHV